MFFLLPTATLGGDGPLDRLHHVTSPPHTFRECADGSLEIRNSIGALDVSPDWYEGKPFIWHGYLNEGHSWEW